MPGIFGLVHKVSVCDTLWDSFHSDAMEIMTNAMRYESYYTRIQYDFRALGIHVGWVGPIERGPFVARQNELSLFLTGRPYCEILGNEEKDLESDKRKNQNFRIVEKYKPVGDNFAKKISGLTSGLLVDEKQQNCFLFNDYFGVDRLFLYEDDEKVIFSSEAKAILAIIPETRAFDPIGLGEFMACGCTFGENSLYRKIRVLPSGSVLKFARKRQPQTTRYLDSSALERLDPIGEKKFLEQFCGTLQTLVRKYIQLPYGAAISLTGGLDSRMIMACLDARDGSVPCYTFGSLYRESYDVLIAREVAKHCNQPHQVLVLDSHFLSQFQYYLNKAVYISDGYLGFSGAAELYLNTLARRISPVRITGNYGGELLRGVRAFRSTIPRGEFLRPELLSCIREAMQSFSQKSKLNSTSFTLFMQAPSGYGRYAIERSQVATVTPFLDMDIVELIYRRSPTIETDKDPSYAVINNCCQALMTIPTDRGQLGRDGWIGRVARRSYREAMFKLEYWTGHGMPDSLAWVSRFSKTRTFEHLFFGRHKFQHFNSWLKNELSNSVSSVLETGGCTNLDQYIDIKRIQEMLTEHQNGRRNFSDEIDKLITLILAERLFLRNEQITKPIGDK